MKQQTSPVLKVHIDAHPDKAYLHLSDVWRYRDFVVSYTRSNFAKRYKQTILGPAWLLINPLITSLMNLFVFGVIAGIGTNGIPKLLFYLAGHGVWAFFAAILTNCSFTFSGNAHIFGKVWFPRLCVPVSYVLISGIEYICQLLPLLGCCIYYALSGIYTIHWAGLFGVLVLLPWLAVLALGVGIIVSSATAKYRDLSLLVSLSVRFWMYATPVVYPLSEVPGELLKTIIRLNPVTPIMELSRYFLFGVGEVSFGMILYSLVITILILVLGLLSFNRVEKSFMDAV